METGFVVCDTLFFCTVEGAGVVVETVSFGATCAGVDDGANASIPSGGITESKSGRAGKSGNSSLAKENGHCTNKKPVIIKNIA